MQQQATTPRYATRIVTVDPTQGLIEGVLKSGQKISIDPFQYPTVFRWPVVGEGWIVVQRNGSWFLESYYPNNISTFQDIEVGDVILTSPTGQLQVVTDGGAGTPFTVNAANLASFAAIAAPPRGIANVSGTSVDTAFTPATLSSATVSNGMTFASNEFTVPIAGWYQLYGIWTGPSSWPSTGYLQCAFVVNGGAGFPSGTGTGSATGGSPFPSASTQAEVHLAAGSTVQFWTFQNAAASVTMNSGFFSVRYTGQ